MAFSSLRWMFGLLLVLSLAACGGSDGKDGVRGSNGQDAKPVLVKTTQEAAGLNCPSGGSRIDSGIDANLNGVLDPAEFQTVSYVCNGEDGADGQDGTNGQDGADGQDGSDGLLALVQTTAISSGAECPSGGVRIDAGIDINESGSLDAAEIQQTSFVCNGSDGADGTDGQDGQDGADGLSALIRTELQSPGAICPAGGIRVLSGVDANRNGQLDAGEETQTSYLCNGEAGQDGGDGFNALLASTQIPSGTQCVSGGYRIDTGLDADGNGLLDLTEVTSSFYVCNGSDGADGQDGMDGLQSLINISTEAPGANCAEGGKLIQSGVDLNANGLLESGEVEQSAFLCNGEDGVDGLNGSDGADGQDGANGQDGADGQNGLNSLVSYTDEPAGANCAAGGVAVNTGLDVDADNVLDTAEIQSTTYVCHGTGGPEEQSFILQYGAQSGGSLVGTLVQEVLLGGSGESVTAVPDSGYYFTSWSDGNSSASRTDGPVQSDLDVVAGFSLYQYTLAYSAGANGSLSGIVGQTVFHGSDGTAVQAIPDEGYHFIQWSDGSTQNPRVDLAVQGDRSVSAAFGINEYTLAYQAGLGGSIMGDSTQTVEHGADATVVAAVPDPGYLFVSWSDGITTTNRTETNVQANLQVTAEFREQLSPPEDVTTGVDSGSLELSWESNPYADSYNIYYALEPGVTPGNFSTLLGGGMLADVSSPVTLNELDGGQRYYFVVTTVIDGVESAVGDEISLLLPNTPWLVSAHQGRLRAELTGSSTATIDWDTAFGESYNLYISKDPEADLSQYASYGVELQLNVTPPVSLSDLVIDEPVYLALEVNGEVSDWTNVISRTWGVNDKVDSQVIGSDGTRYLGGHFTLAGMNVGSVALFPAGNNDVPHLLATPQVNGAVNDVVSDGHGGWYIGGDFTKVGSYSRLRLAHIDASGRVTSWNPGANDSVYALSFYGDALYVGGDFTAAGNGVAQIARNKLAAISADGSLLGWNPYANGVVTDIAVGDDAIFIAGEFTAIGGGSEAVTRFGLAKIGMNGSLDSWNVSLYGKFNSIAYHSGNLYVGGEFSKGGRLNDGSSYSVPAPRYLNNLAKISATEVGNFSPGAFSYFVVGGEVRDIEVTEDGRLIIGGEFSDVIRSYFTNSFTQGVIVYHESSCATPKFSSLALASSSCSNEGVEVEGDVNAVGWGDGAPILAIDNGTKWGIDGSLINAFAVVPGQLFVAGGFDVAAGERRLRLSAFDADGYLTGWDPGANASVNSMVIHNDIIYAGGNFTLSGAGSATTVRRKLAAYDLDGNLLNWNPEVNSEVSEIDISNDIIYAGGFFTQATDSLGVKSRHRLAAFDLDGNVMAWNPGANSYVNALSVYDGLIYVGGNFTAVGNGTGTVLHNHVAAVDPSGVVATWPGVANDNVTALAVDNGVVYISGSFSAAGGGGGSAPRNGLAAIGVNGDLTNWNPGLAGGIANTLLPVGGLIYAGGSFTGAGGGVGVKTVSGLAAFNSAGVLSSWDPEVNGGVSSIATDGTSILVSGEFTRASDDAREVSKSRMATFDLNGQLQDR